MPIIKGSWFGAHSKSCLALLCTNNSLLATQMCSVLTPASCSPESSQLWLILNPSIPQGFPGLHFTKAMWRLPSCPLRRQGPSSAFCQAWGPRPLCSVCWSPRRRMAGWPPFTHKDIPTYSASRGINSKARAKTNTLRLLLFSCVSGIMGRVPIICFILLKFPKPHWFFLTWSESLGISCYLCTSLALDSEEALGDVAGERTEPWLWIKESRVWTASQHPLGTEPQLPSWHCGPGIDMCLACGGHLVTGSA